MLTIHGWLYQMNNCYTEPVFGNATSKPVGKGTRLHQPCFWVKMR